MTDLRLQIEGLSAGYRGVAVVRDLSLSVHSGEVVVLLGPNGAGKTTTLLTVSVLLPIIAGQIRVLGQNVANRAVHKIARAGLAHVPEDRSRFLQLTVTENQCLGAGRGTPDVARALRDFPALEPVLDRRAGLLSGSNRCWQWGAP